MRLPFIFDYLLYKQVDGVAIGSPLGPTLANAFLCHYGKEWLDNCPVLFKPYTKGMLMIFLFFFYLRTPTFCRLYEQTA